MIDPATGRLGIDKPIAVLDSSVTIMAFRQSALGRRCRPLYGPAPWSMTGLPLVELEDEPFTIAICFHGEQLEFVALASRRPSFGTSFDELSKEKEAARQRFHNEWLRQQFQNHPWVPSHEPEAPVWTWCFPWGRVLSGWDTKNGTTEIVVRYRQDGRPMSL